MRIVFKDDFMIGFGSFSAAARGPFSLIFYWFLYYFVEIDFFDVGADLGAILGRLGAILGPLGAILGTS